MVETRALKKVWLVEGWAEDQVEDVPIVNDQKEGNMENKVQEVRNPNQEILQ